jgi:hypothetical protein
MTNRTNQSREPRSSGSVGLARAFWFFLGPMTLGVLAYGMVSAGSGWVTWLDAAFLGVAVLMLLARRHELKSGEGADGFGQPATLADFPKYAMWAVPAALGVWVAANTLGNHVIG